MEFTDSHHCKSSRNLLSLLGQWPYQNPRDHTIRSIFLCLVIDMIFILQCIKYPRNVYSTFYKLVIGAEFQLTKLFRSYQDLNLIENIPPVITTIVCITKLHVLILNKQKMKNLLDEINDDWKERTILEEKKVMENYMNQGKTYGIIYMWFMYGIAFIFSIFVFKSCILNIVSKGNETYPLQMPYPVEFFIDERKYFIWITVISITTTFAAITVLIAFDTMLIIYVQYICGMLTIVGFVSLLESAFMLAQLIQLGLNVVCLSTTLVRLIETLNSLDILKSLLYTIGQLLHILYISYQSERLINHSLNISRKIYNGTWYNIPKESQKMLLFILRRSNIPCYLTAGKIFIFCMQNFSMIVQNSMSYFMVLISFE